MEGLVRRGDLLVKVDSSSVTSPSRMSSLRHGIRGDSWSSSDEEATEDAAEAAEDTAEL